MKAHWQALQRALDQGPRPARFWWRDDDAVADTAALRQLLALQQHCGSPPLHLAVVPMGLSRSLAPLLDAGERVLVLQHGIAHRDNSRPEQRRRELGGAAPPERQLAELLAGRERLLDAFGARWRALLVPPWNRIDAPIQQRLAGGPWRALSVLGPAPPGARPPQLNVHLDLIDWRRRRFAGEAHCLSRLCALLAARAEQRAAEPIGLMSHHLDHDRDCWDFLNQLLPVLQSHPHAALCDVDDLLGGAP